MNHVSNPLIDRVMTFLDRLFLLRPPLFFPVWLAVATGLGAGDWLSDPNLFWRIAWHWGTGLLFVGITFLSGAAVLLAQIARTGGTAQGYLSVLDQSGTTPDRARRLAWIYLASGLVLILPSGLLALLAGFILFLVWGGLDSTLPALRRDGPGLQALRHVLAGASLFYVGWGGSGAPLAVSPELALPYILGFGGIGALATLYTGPGTSSGDVRPGAPRYLITLLAASTAVVVAAVTGYTNGDPVISTAAVVALPFFAVALIYRRSTDALRALRYSILIVAIFVVALQQPQKFTEIPQACWLAISCLPRVLELLCVSAIWICYVS